MFCSRLHQLKWKNKNPCRYAAPRRVAVIIVSGLFWLPPAAVAQQWLFTPEIEIAAHHIENPRLEEDGEEDGDTENITGGLVDLAAAMRRNTETSSVLIRPAATIYRYSGDTDEDSEAYFLDFNATNQGQRSSWRLLGNYRQQQVFRGETTPAEIDDIGVDDSVQTGTGRTFERRQRDLWHIQPGFSLDFTERTAFKLDFSYLDVQYDTEELGEAVDYDNSRIDAAIVRAISPESNLEFGVFASRYDPSRANGETDSIGARARYEKEVSNISTFFIDVGAQESDAESAVGPDSDDSETAFLWNLGYVRQLEVTRWRFEIGHNVTPSGSGALLERDLARVIMDHQLQPRWSMQLSAALMNSQTLSEQDLVSNNERDYAQGRATLAYQMTPAWTIEGLYSFTYQDFADLPGDAQEHEIRLSFVYQPPIPTR